MPREIELSLLGDNLTWPYPGSEGPVSHTIRQMVSRSIHYHDILGIRPPVPHYPTHRHTQPMLDIDMHTDFDIALSVTDTPTIYRPASSTFSVPTRSETHDYSGICNPDRRTGHERSIARDGRTNSEVERSSQLRPTLWEQFNPRLTPTLTSAGSSEGPSRMTDYEIQNRTVSGPSESNPFDHQDFSTGNQTYSGEFHNFSDPNT